MKQNKKVLEKKEKPFDFVLFITVLVLLAMGIVMVLSASSPSALSETGNSYHYVTRQAIFAVIGIILMVVISKIDYRIYSRFAKIAYVASVIMLLAVPILGTIHSSGTSKGATRWLDLGFVRFQPSEIAKIALIIFYATWLTKNKDKLKTFKSRLFCTIFISCTNCSYISFLAKPFKCYNYHNYSNINNDANGRN